MSKLTSGAEDGKGHIIREGPFYRIIAFKDDKGNEPSLNFLEGLDQKDRTRIELLFERLCDQGKITNKEKFRHERDQIYVFKSFQIRIYCFFAPDRVVVLTHGAIKKKDKASEQDINRAKEIRSKFM